MKLKTRPEVITYEEPEKQHFINNYKNEKFYKSSNQNDQNSFILVIGDSMTNDLNSYDLKQSCKGARFMVRSLRGGKIKKYQKLSN